MASFWNCLRAITAAIWAWCGAVPHGAFRPTLQPGNTLEVNWRARIAENLGSYTIELAKARAGALMESRSSLVGLTRLLHPLLVPQCPNARRMPLFMLWERFCWMRWQNPTRCIGWCFMHAGEAGLLEALGFGLDLAECAATGATDDLIYVSPRSGRAVSKAGAGIYANPGCFGYPGFSAENRIVILALSKSHRPCA